MNIVTSFIYTFDPDADEPIMMIDRHIGFDEIDGWGIMGDLFQKELLALDDLGKKRIQIWINSPGGIVSDGYNIYNAILRTKTPVDTYNIGIAASIAAVIFQAGRKRIMSDYSMLMYHNPYGSDDDKGLTAIRESIVTMISSRTQKPAEDISKIMNRTTWINADEALADGFCDEIQASSELNKKRSVNTAEQVKDFWKASNKAFENLYQNKTLPIMKKVANKLNLNPEATEDSIVSEIEKIENRAKKAEEAIVNKSKSLEDKEAELAKMKEECDALKAEIADMKKKAKAKEDEEAKAKAEAEEAENKAKEEKAKNLIDGFVVAGRIKNDEAIKNSWIKKAKEDYDGVKSLIESLPVSAKSTKIETGNGEDHGKKLTSVVANKMAELKAKGH